LETQVDKTSNNLDSGLKRVKEFINANAGMYIFYFDEFHLQKRRVIEYGSMNTDTKQQICIVGLIVILIILIVLLFTV
jgi:hypothetical protein